MNHRHHERGRSVMMAENSHIFRSKTHSNTNSVFQQSLVHGGQISSSSSSLGIDRKSFCTILGTAATLVLIFWKGRELCDTERLVATLERLNASGPSGIIIYILIFMLWEMSVGMTTPVETAAGMAFGVRRGILASGLGKTLGALAAFSLARNVLYDRVRSHIDGGNELLLLLKQSVLQRPFQVALLTRFSPLPEPVKNGSMAVLLPNETKTTALFAFFLSLILHGLPFTCLWTILGAETANVLRSGTSPSNTLKALVAVSTWIGVCTQVLIAVCINRLRQQDRKGKESTVSV